MDQVREDGDGKPQPEEQPQEEVNALQSRLDLEGDVFFDAVEEEHLRAGGPASLADRDAEPDVVDDEEDKEEEETGGLGRYPLFYECKQKLTFCTLSPLLQ